ncbi:hypothetical protein HRbin14_01931 [bacterium HR14]|nr:hypothetical protein HRbin14_01931 [bacterium HR14]
MALALGEGLCYLATFVRREEVHLVNDWRMHQLLAGKPHQQREQVVALNIAGEFEASLPVAYGVLTIL